MRAYLWPAIVVAAAVSAGAGATAQSQPGAATSGSALLAQLPRESVGTNPGGQWQIAERAGYAMDGCALTISVAKWSSPATGGAAAPLPGYAVQFQARKGLPFRRRLMTDGEKAAFAAKYPNVAGKIYDATVATVDFAGVRPSSFKVLDVKLDGGVSSPTPTKALPVLRSRRVTVRYKPSTRCKRSAPSAVLPTTNPNSAG